MDYTIAANTTAMGAGDTAPTTGTAGEFTSGNPATNTPATTLPGYQMTAIVREIVTAIQGAGLTADRANNAQLLAAIKVLAGGGTYTVATLPAASAAWPGRRAMVTDATNPTFLGALTGGGSTECPVVYTSSGWVAG